MKHLARILPVCFVAALAVQAFAQNLSTSETYRNAYDQGYVDGLELGREDREQQRLFDFANKRSFQRADEGFDPSRHDREIYLVAYRRGFEDGYEDGYQLRSKAAAYPSPAPPPSSKPVDAVDLPAPSDPPDLTPETGLKIPSGTEMKVKLLDSLGTERNERGDSFRAETVEDVVVDQDVVIPAGTRIRGTISSLKRAGRIKGRAEMNLRFGTLEFADGRAASIEAVVDSIERRADSDVKDEEGTVQVEGTKGEDARKVGVSSAIGALIGVLTGGKRGAGSGAAIGAVAGLAGVLVSRGKDLRLYSETEMTIRLEQEAVVPFPDPLRREP